MKITHTEEFELSLKEIFILQEMFSFSDHEMGFWGDHDYLHSRPTIGYTSKVDEERNTHDSFCSLREKGLIDRSDSGAEGTYFRYKISEKGLKIYQQIERVDTTSLHFLRPSKEKQNE